MSVGRQMMLSALMPLLMFDSFEHQSVHSGKKKWSETIDIESQYHSMMKSPRDYEPWQRAVLKKRMKLMGKI